jgi:3-oxoacyl-[acyl-carrier-protein] synthase III
VTGSGTHFPPQPAELRRAGIAAIEYALPERVVSNGELEGLHPGWKVTEVAKRTGVFSRHWCAPEETALDLAVTACGRMLERNPHWISRCDAILFCTQSPDHWMPPNACLLQDRLGLPRATAAFDFSLACSGFVYGLWLANALVTSGSAKQVLLVTADTYSKWMHPEDRGPVTLFGDGAAVTVVTRSESGLGHCALGTDGSGASVFCVPAGGARTPRSPETADGRADLFGNVRSAEHLLMNGPAVLDFVKREMPGFVRSFLKRAGESVESVDLVVFHQASLVGLDYLNVALEIPEDKRFSNIASIGNTVSASIPIALRQAEEDGRLLPGMRVLLVGFGVGLSWGVTIITWGAP